MWLTLVVDDVQSLDICGWVYVGQCLDVLWMSLVGLARGFWSRGHWLRFVWELMPVGLRIAAVKVGQRIYGESTAWR
jgi:hypothetical protein